MVTDLEKKIYNTYLKITRTKKGVPFRYRMNFTDFETNKNYVYVKRIANLLKKNKNVLIEDYFSAPYEVYDAVDEFYTLKFYASIKAVGVYKLYIKKAEDESPDSDRQITELKKSLRFVYQYCLNNNIGSVEEYLKKQDGHVYAWMKHYTNLDISVIFLLENDIVYDILMSIDEDVRDMMLGGLEKKYFKLRENYLKSNKGKSILKNGITLINKKLKNATNKK